MTRSYKISLEVPTEEPEVNFGEYSNKEQRLRITEGIKLSLTTELGNISVTETTMSFMPRDRDGQEVKSSRLFLQKTQVQSLVPYDLQYSL